MKKIILSLFFSVGVFIGAAQVNWANIGVDGLTCSACTRAVEMSLRNLDFVDSVSMNLEHTEGKIFFKKNSKVNFDKISQAVIDAGFSLRNLEVAVVFKEAKVSENSCLDYEGNVFQFIKTENKTLNGEVKVKIIGNRFLSNKEMKTWKPLLKEVCGDKKAKVYFVAA